MVVGFNHNVRYKGHLFHVQTEDSGLKNPHIITLLYYGGTILSSNKTSYADIARVDNLESVVEDLMKEQHKDMLRQLKSGVYDSNIEALLGGKAAPAVTEPAAAPPPKPKPEPKPVEKPEPKPEPKPVEKAEPKGPVEESLDDLILSYLVGDEKKK